MEGELIKLKQKFPEIAWAKKKNNNNNKTKQKQIKTKQKEKLRNCPRIKLYLEYMTSPHVFWKYTAFG